jgi:hypothetical protein
VTKVALALPVIGPSALNFRPANPGFALPPAPFAAIRPTAAATRRHSPPFGAIRRTAAAAICRTAAAAIRGHLPPFVPIRRYSPHRRIAAAICCYSPLFTVPPPPFAPIRRYSPHRRHHLPLFAASPPPFAAIRRIAAAMRRYSPLFAAVRPRSPLFAAIRRTSAAAIPRHSLPFPTGAIRRPADAVRPLTDTPTFCPTPSFPSAPALRSRIRLRPSA